MRNFTLSQSNNKAVKESFNWIKENGIKENKFPMIYSFLTNPDDFYIKYCPSLLFQITREKRFLDFETPNRVHITHEYDIQLKNEFNFNKYYFLFNPLNRLGWLKIRQGREWITIAKSTEVKKTIFRILWPEIQLFANPKETMQQIWGLKRGYPCFIKLNKSHVDNFILSCMYYESIKPDSVKRTQCYFSWLNPLKERNIIYSYIPIEKASSWLYIKAPDHFVIKYEKADFDSENNIIEISTLSEGDEPDLEKISLTIINKREPTKNIPKITFGIKVPTSLKFWYFTIYYLSILTLLLTIGSFINKLYLKFYEPLFYININPDLFSHGEFISLVLAIIAGIIATRGWLIHEETILKKFSTHESIILFLIIIFFIVGVII